jgi:predicted DNA-binding transcriptional regulator AlpA
MRDTDVVSFAEGLRLLGVSRSSAYSYMQDPASSFLRPFRIGGRWRYRRTDCERWLAEQAAAAQVRSVHPRPRGALESISA